jgi:multiple antibiotic resistance protein
MTSNFYSFLHFAFIGFVALFPVVNPLGSAFIVSPYFSELSNKKRVMAVKRIAFYAFCICLVTLLTGHWILELFGLSIPIVQLAGGIMICKIGWDFLTPKKQDNMVKPSEPNNLNLEATIDNKLFYPITFPITTGAGTISVLFTLSAQGTNKNINQYLLNTSAIMLAVIGICILIFICYVNANKLINYMGSQSEKIVNSIMAFLIFCVGLQIAVEGIIQIYSNR